MSTSYVSASPAEISLPWNGDFSFDETGDLILATDSPTDATATEQRLVRLLFTAPWLTDQNGNPIATPDDFFHPTWGAGLRAYVDASFDQQTLDQIKADTLNALLKDPGVSPTPAPQITFLKTSPTELAMVVRYQPTSGKWTSLPTLNLTTVSVISSASANGG